MELIKNSKLKGSPIRGLPGNNPALDASPFPVTGLETFWTALRAFVSIHSGVWGKCH